MPDINRPIKETPYDSLIYLRHYVKDSGTGLFILTGGIREKPYFPIQHPNPITRDRLHLSENFRKYLRDKVERRPATLENLMEREKLFAGESLSFLEGHGYTCQRPTNKSTLGETLVYLLESKKITSHHFKQHAKKNLVEELDTVLVYLAKASIDIIIPQARHFNPNDSKIQYEYLINYLIRG